MVIGMIIGLKIVVCFVLIQLLPFVMYLPNYTFAIETWDLCSSFGISGHKYLLQSHML